MSSDNPGGNPGRRKFEVSYATLIGVGLVGPKVQPTGNADGQLVKIPAPSQIRYAEGGRGQVDAACPLDMACASLQASGRVKTGRVTS